MPEMHCLFNNLAKNTKQKMERIKSLMQKFQEIYYSKHPKSAIDIDLMMDYTRIMYIDLIEWRREFTEPVHSDIIAIMQEEPTQTIQPAASQPSAALEKPVVKETMEEAKAETMVVAAQEAYTQPVAEEKTIEEETPASVEGTEPWIAQEPEAAEEAIIEVKDNFPEAVELETISHERSGISFEPPSHVAAPVEMNEVLEEEAPAAPIPTVIEIPAPAPAQIPLPEFKPYEPAKLFDNIVELKDIRTVIGINDKYLFLNELFNNHKSNYEETLDKLNKIKSPEEAREWVKNNAAASFKWDNNDVTVQSFYAVLDKHFSSK